MIILKEHDICRNCGRDAYPMFTVGTEKYCAMCFHGDDGVSFVKELGYPTEFTPPNYDFN